MKKIPFFLFIIIVLAACASINKNLTSSEKEFLSYVRYIITDEERQEFLNLAPDSSERVRFMQDFWIKWDPDPRTPGNEFREAYFKRIEAANKLFRGGRPGWLTDRGMILVLLGPPDDREDFPMGRTSEEKPSEIWTYHNLPNKSELRLEFVDYSGTNDYKLVTNISRESINSFVRMDMNLSDGIISPTAAVASRKPPQDLKLEKMQETDKAVTTKQEKTDPPGGEVEVSYREIRIPTQVGELLDQNIETQTPQKDIGITYLQTLYMPAQLNNVHAVFLFKIINTDLAFLWKDKDSVTDKEASKPEENPKLNVFLRIHNRDNGKIMDIIKEIYIPYFVEQDKIEFQRDQEHLYSISDPLPPGDYLLALAVASDDLAKIGTTTVDFSLPKTSAFYKKMDTTPVFFIKSMEKLPGPETEIAMHQDYFRYSVLKIRPKEANIFKPEEAPDIFYFVYGARPDKDRKFRIEVDYQIKKDNQVLRKYETQTYASPFVSHPLPLDLEGKTLEPGAYILEIKIRDNVSRLSTTKDIPFEVK